MNAFSVRSQFIERAFSHAGPAAWSLMREHIRAEPDIHVFRKLLKTCLFNLAFNVHWHSGFVVYDSWMHLRSVRHRCTTNALDDADDDIEDNNVEPPFEHYMTDLQCKLLQSLEGNRLRCQLQWPGRRAAPLAERAWSREARPGRNRHPSRWHRMTHSHTYTAWTHLLKLHIHTHIDIHIH